MAFTTNSVRQLYIANGFSSSATTPGYFKTAVKTSQNELYLTYINTESKEVKTPSIPIANIRYVKSTAYVPKCLRKDAITFDVPIVGQTYTIRFLIRSWGSGSAEDQYFKHVGSYKAKTNDTAEDIVDAMITNATANFAREPLSLFTFTKEGSGATTKLIVTEVQTPWVLGKSQGRGLDYSIQFVKINNSGVEDYEWGTVTSMFKANPGVGTNHLAKDMEYFYLGERGDIYRNVGYPFTFDTQYLADATANYSTIDIAYFKTEPHNGGAVQSECMVTILCAETAVGTTMYAVQIALAGAVNTATGATTIPLLVNVDKVILKSGSLGTAGDDTVTGLTATKKYILYTNPGTPDETKLYTLAGGATYSADEADAAALGVGITALTGLTSGTRYFVQEYTF